jgi:stage II sporulation protein GA (sporulation sigma-E factor processing peptidase)
VIYPDLVLLVNFVVDYLLLWATGLLGNGRVRAGRLAAAAGLGAAYALLAQFPSFMFLFNAPIKISFSLALLLIAFSPVSPGQLLRLTAYFYGIGFTMAGASLALLVLGNPTRPAAVSLAGAGDLLQVSGMMLPLGSSLVATGIGAALIGGKYLFDYARSLTSLRRSLLQAEIVVDRRKVRLTALVDTGNQLLEPFSRTPVIVADFGAIEPLFPPELKEVLASHAFFSHPFASRSHRDLAIGVDAPKRIDLLWERLADEVSGSGWEARIRLIPFEALGQENGLLLGFRPDEVALWKGGKRLVCRRAVVGVYSRKLSSEGLYEALAPPDLLDREQLA